MFDNRAVEAAGPLNAPPPADAVVAAAKARQRLYDGARGDLGRAQSRLADLTDNRDTAAAKVATPSAVRATTMWPTMAGLTSWTWWTATPSCSRLSAGAWVRSPSAACVIALFVPGLDVVAAGILLGVAVAATSTRLIPHCALALSGSGSWVDVGMDAWTVKVRLRAVIAN